MQLGFQLISIQWVVAQRVVRRTSSWSPVIQPNAKESAQKIYGIKKNQTVGIPEDSQAINPPSIICTQAWQSHCISQNGICQGLGD